MTVSIEVLADEYRAATGDFLDVAESVTPDRLDRCVPGEWSARQVIHHMSDSEAQSYARLRRLLAEPSGSIIQGYDEAAWARCQLLGYEELPVEHSLDVIGAVRAASLDVIQRLADSDLDRFGVHTRVGPYSVRMWLDTYIAHPSVHGAQLTRAATAGSPTGE